MTDGSDAYKRHEVDYEFALLPARQLDQKQEMTEGNYRNGNTEKENVTLKYFI